MARLASSSISYENQRVLSVRVRLLHVLIVVAATLAAVAITLPSVLSQRTLYVSQAVVRFDPAALPGLLEADGTPSAALEEAQDQLGAVLSVVGGPGDVGYEGLRLGYTYPQAGQIVVQAYSLNPDTAAQIADEAAGWLARRLIAENGDKLLRSLLGAVEYASLSGQPAAAADPETKLWRDVILAQAVGGVAPEAGIQSVAQLSKPDRDAIARALEVREDEILVDLTRARQRLQALPASDVEGTAAALEQELGAERALSAVRAAIRFLIDTYNTALTGKSDAPAGVAQSAAPATMIATYGRWKIGIAALVGAVGGLLVVLIDRQVGILPKLQELWSYRELVRNMVARDLKARYKGSVLGYFWSLLNPLLMMLVFWVVFSLLLNNSIRMFPVFLIVALLPWQFAVASVSGGMRSIIDNANLVKKVYFPREILPLTVVLSNLVNYILALPVMLLVMAAVQRIELGQLNFSWTFAFLPVIVGIQVIFLIGISLLLSTTAVFFRDTTHIVDILLQLWIFLTPVFFAFEQIATADQARVLRWINPMASIIDFYRDILYGQAAVVAAGEVAPVPVPGLPALDGVFRTLLTALVVLALGAYVFHRHSGRFGEEI